MVFTVGNKTQGECKTMLFNSYIFILAFLPVTFFVYFYLNTKRLTEAAKAFLVLASLFFYSYWNINYLPLILGSMLFNYVLGNILSQAGTKKSFKRHSTLCFGVGINLAAIGYFKYYDFFITNVNGLCGTSFEILNLMLPLAISFFTFQQIAYLIDSYRHETKEYDFLNYALFVTFFPQLIAGPIVHHKEVMPQFAQTRNKVKNYDNIARGLFVFSIGLFKKVEVADTFAAWATNGFNAAAELNIYEAWFTSLSYTLQLYFDFSGYTDMAIGIALLFNITLPLNFNSPYKAMSIQDFWRRWHMTLSRFLRDYLYIPLGGSRCASYRIYINILITFTLAGLWHGAGWTFILWGVLHGIALCINRFWQQRGFKLNKIVAWFITFNFVNITWIFFRAETYSKALDVIYRMFNFSNILRDDFSRLLLRCENEDTEKLLQYLGFYLLIALFSKNASELKDRFKANWLTVLATVTFLYYSLTQMNNISEFLYFNF